jgi:hypothetical protein
MFWLFTSSIAIKCFALGCYSEVNIVPEWELLGPNGLPVACPGWGTVP